MHFLACVDRFFNLLSIKFYFNSNAHIIEHSLKKNIAIYGLPRSIRLNQTRCQRENIAQEFFNNNNLKTIFSPAKDHRSIGLVERLIQTVKRRRGCIKHDPKQHPFNIKHSLRQIAQKLRICRKKATKISPFKPHFGCPANITITNLTSSPSSCNLK